MTDRLPGLHLQRRAGRRKSNPASPTSPTFRSRFGKSQDSSLPVFSPSEATISSATNESPSLDLNVPSPTFDMSTISTALPSENNAPHRMQQTNRASDDFGKSRPKFLAEMMRPATSSATGGIPYSSQSRPMYSPEPASSRDSPSSASQRTSADAQRRPTSRENHEEAVAQRAAAFWAQYDRSIAEDASTSRGLGSNKKSRFNLLNPMSLLARRRSSQNTNKLDDGNLGNLHVPAMPDNIDPSIRGSIVHDWSVPKPRRLNVDNSPRPAPAPSPKYPRRPSELTSPPADTAVGTPSSLHSPMFKEHFLEDGRSVQPTNTAYLHGQNLHQPSSGSLPSFAKNLPLVPPGEESAVHTPAELPATVSPTTQAEVTLPPEPDIPPPPPPPPPPEPQRTPSPVLDPTVTSALPKHMTSTSSRFSFVGQQGSIAQEKFLEEKHKEHASKNPAPVRLSMASVDDIDNYDNYDGLDEEDGFDNGEITIRNINLPSSQALQQYSGEREEDYESDVDDEDFDYEDEFGTGDIEIRNVDIPTSHSKLDVNQESGEDVDDDSIHSNNTPTNQNECRETEKLNYQHQPLQGFHFTPQSLSFSPSTTQNTSQSTPRDVEGFVIGMARSKEGQTYNADPRIRDSMEQSPENMFYEGLGISTTHTDESSFIHPQTGIQHFDDSDLYYDDGEFDDDDVIAHDSQFNEDALDDASQIKDIPAENARKYEEALQRGLIGEKARTLAQSQPQNSVTQIENSDVTHKDSATDNQVVLSEDNLAAYHDALASAANQAAADGKFIRSVSFSQLSDDETDSPFHNSIPVVSSRGSRYSNNVMSSGISDDDGFGFDDNMDDDAMDAAIAAANAEALENDDDGVYGQEFGFYARAYSKDPAELVNGGYFASRGSNGLKRSHSGRNNYQEPSLTPITERSEWSTRNSMASLHPPTGLSDIGQSLPSPGIAQLLERDSPVVEDEMSMTAFLKLKTRTFAGSSTSINSLADRHYPHSSPLAHTSGFGGANGEGMVGQMSSPTPNRSAMSIAESEDEDEEYGRPTLTQNTPHKRPAIPVRDSSHSSQEHVTSSPMTRKANHSRNSSGAESVSYAMEEDGRWVLERRRTGDDGELELVHREHLAGVRI